MMQLLTRLWSNNIHANKLYHSLPKFLFNNTKYKNSEDLEQGYIELQKKLGQQEDTAEEAEEARREEAGARRRRGGGRGCR